MVNNFFNENLRTALAVVEKVDFNVLFFQQIKAGDVLVIRYEGPRGR